MPTYEYRCDACENVYEKFESMTSKPDPVCPQCNKKKAKRLISAGAGFLFKGSGFYTTDYRSSTYKESVKKESSSPVPSAPTGTSGDAQGAVASKPETKVSKPSKKKAAAAD